MVRGVPVEDVRQGPKIPVEIQFSGGRLGRLDARVAGAVARVRVWVGCNRICNDGDGTRLDWGSQEHTATLNTVTERQPPISTELPDST